MSRILYQGHASLRIITNNKTVIYIDPYAGNGYDIPADLILVTHQHYDHNKISKPKKKEDCIIFQNSDALKDNEYKKVNLKGIIIEAVPAYNFIHRIDKCVGYIITFDNKTLYFAGDTSKTKEMMEYKNRNIDYAFLPIDGIFNMGIKKATECAELIHAKYTVPIHMKSYSLFSEKKADKFSAANKLILKPEQEIEI